MIMGSLLVAILVILVGGFYLFVDLEEIEAILKQKLSEETGLKVEFDDLKFDFHEEFGLKATHLKIESLDGKDHLLSAKKLFLKVKLMPLLDSKVEIKKLDLVEPEITVYLEEAPTPVKAKKVKAQPAPSKKKDDTQPVAPPIQNLPPSPKESAIDTVRSIFRELELAVDSIEIENGNIALVKRKGEKVRGTKNVRLSMETVIHRPDKDQLSLFIDSLSASMGNLKLKGKIDVKDILSDKGPWKPICIWALST